MGLQFNKCSLYDKLFWSNKGITKAEKNLKSPFLFLSASRHLNQNRSFHPLPSVFSLFWAQVFGHLFLSWVWTS